MATAFPKLFSEMAIGHCVLGNRIVSTGHHTYLADNVPGDALIAYHEARAKGGVGLIVSEIVAVHETAGFSRDLLKVTSRDVIPDYKKLVDACHRHGTRVFAQLFHPGREILSSPDGMSPVAWAPSAVPNERFHIMPKAMSAVLIRDIIDGFGRTASVLAEAGFDGFEIVASHGYLPSQFLNPECNLREDEYGGDAAKRLRFLNDVIQSIRAGIDDQVIGLRISGSELDSNGLSETDVKGICCAVADKLDYLSITAGTSASLGASVHITPPMGVQAAYMAGYTKALRSEVNIPVILSGRINQPHTAEQVLERGEADLCGMTRALICDPLMPSKAKASINNVTGINASGVDTTKLDSIRACIGCNQSCIGRAHKGVGISCIQYPESGRELQFGTLPVLKGKAKKIIVAGAGPAGMKAAIVAAKRGHDVTLYEASGQIGGQALLAQRLPGREDFGSLVTNLASELMDAGVEVHKNTKVTQAMVTDYGADVLIVATGAIQYLPQFEGHADKRVVNAWDVIQDKASIGSSVVIADWRADWIGLGLAERLALSGCSVVLCVNGSMAGETIQLYTRNHYVGRLHKLGVDVRTHLRLAGFVDGSVYFQDTLTEEPVELASVDTLVLSLGHQPYDELTLAAEEQDADEQATEKQSIEVFSIGDCVAARTAEEAIYEGLLTGCKV